jgi:hypothetical protein
MSFKQTSRSAVAVTPRALKRARVGGVPRPAQVLESIATIEGKLERENAELRRRAVQLALEIQELSENRARYN